MSVRPASLHQAVTGWTATPKATYDRLIVDLHRAVSAGAYVFPPAHAVELLSCDPVTEADRIVMLSARDPDLAGRIMWLAGTPIYGDSGTFSSVRSVIQRLGSAFTREIIGHAVVSLYTCPPPHFRHWRGQICAQAAGVGFACDALVRKDRDAGWAFAAGVLHDSSKGVLIQLLARFPDGLAAPGEMARNIIEREHTRVGIDVALRHRLSRPLACAVTRHHDYDPYSEDDAPATLVGLGRRIWRASGRGLDGLSSWPEVPGLGLRHEDVERTIEQVLSIRPRLLELANYLDEDMITALAS